MKSQSQEPGVKNQKPGKPGKPKNHKKTLVEVVCTNFLIIKLVLFLSWFLVLDSWLLFLPTSV